ncbi:SARP family transcriptional regulator [Actinorhabdospora filicis]|uniref:SARP family transcriptional regulator n=1 Tax=Actinorhabdospora filicis TaxID=1785913 RepID=A0A9W6WBG2_9ACTN|nr:BTAD domain-containing putative transcriptional regulator [Actinorhabdospora filicis]GLZ79536.1 SARP family transcriptional regulator [Actinorhabdospora filicis]
MRVHTGDTTAHVDGSKQRALLGALIARAGRAVSTDALTTALWGDSPPASPRKAITWHIGQVRELLDRPDRLTWRGGGYVLSAEPGEIDAARFEELRTAGLTALRDDDPATAADRFAEALGLWRGEAYADVPEHAVPDGEATRLEGLRLDVLAHRITADLDLGRHDALVPELTGLVAAHPLDEGFRARLMLALYRSGRRADALEVYREGRRLLVSELGLEPGPELRAMEQTVLAGESVADEPARTTGPAELPAAPRAFTGREDDIAGLLAVFDDPGAVCAVAGPGGIGKSALALHVAHKLAPRFPDGQLYVNLHGTTPDVKSLAPEEVLGRFLRSLLGEAPAAALDVEELAGRFRSATAGKRLLIVIDDARDAAQVRPLLPGSPTCAVIVTGRRLLSTLDEAVLHRLEVLPERESLAVLSRLVGERRVAAEPTAARDITRHCDGLPLALIVAAARLRSRPRASLASLAVRLGAEDARLGELALDDRAVRASLAVSHRELAEEVDGARAARLFGLLGVADTPDLTVPVAAALADVGDPAAGELLGRLVDAQLLDEHDERFRLHDLVRLFAKEQGVPREEAVDAFERVLGHYAGFARRILGVFEPSATFRREFRVSAAERPGPSPADREEALRWLRAEVDNLHAVLRQATTMPPERAAQAVTISFLVKLPLHYAKAWGDMRTIALQAIAVADALGDPELRLTSHRDLAEMLLPLNLVDEALVHLGIALESVRLMDERSGEASILGITGAAYRRLGRYQEALVMFGQGVEKAREYGLAQVEAATLVEMGFLYAKLDDRDAALDAQERAAVIAESLGSPHGQAITSAAIASLLYDKKRFQESADRFQHAIEMNRAAGQEDVAVAADYTWGLAEAQYAMGRKAEARVNWDLSLALLQRLGLITEEEKERLAGEELPEPPPIISMRRT